MKQRSPLLRGHDNREIGWREHVALPELGIASMRAKIDTGARTSALSASNLEPFEREGQAWIRFALPGGRKSGQRCEARLVDARNIKNTGGVPEYRAIIQTPIVLGTRSWMIEISLADRRNMTFDMIIGRTAIRKQRLLVNPGRSFLAGPPVQPTSD